MARRLLCLGEGQKQGVKLKATNDPCPIRRRLMEEFARLELDAVIVSNTGDHITADEALRALMVHIAEHGCK